MVVKENMKINNADKITLKEALLMDGGASYSKVSKLLANLGDEKSIEMGLIPKIHSYNGRKRLFRLQDVEKWINR